MVYGQRENAINGILLYAATQRHELATNLAGTIAAVLATADAPASKLLEIENAQARYTHLINDVNVYQAHALEAANRRRYSDETED